MLLYLAENQFKWNRKTVLGASAFVALSLSIYLFGPNLKAKWWLIDDHEIFYFLKSKDSQSSWLQYFYILLNQTEVGNFGNSQRYRSSYYFLRVFETLLWKDNPLLWYSFRLGIAALFSFSILKLLTKYFSFSLSFLFLLSVFSLRYWSDIFSRMATSETYAVLGISLILIGISNFRNQSSNSLWTYVSIAVGVMIAEGAKENFLIFICIPLLILFLERKTLKTWSSKVVLTVPIVYGGSILLSLYLFFRKVQVDIYGNSTKASDRLSVFLNYLNNELVIGCMILIGILIILIVFYSIKFRKYSVSFPELIPFFFFGLLLINILFYNGSWPTNSRYDFPGLLGYQCVIAFTVYLIVSKILDLAKVTLPEKNFVANLILIFFLCSFTPLSSITNLQRDSRINMKRTQEFTSFLNVFLADKSDRFIIFYVNQAFDFEPVDSFLRFLNYYEDARHRMLIVTKSEAESKFKNGLLNYLRTVSKDGSVERKILPFDSKALKGKPCILLLFPPASLQDAPNIPECKDVDIKLVPFQ
ncbi:hypothetical protein [Leptospira tipperaryensis]|uniref:hypothetical protein n=1 Tax=Leptospira tipperaryensis TaxID=2564040 RepID=UPI0012EA6ED2|nr:hypothetical protein [Leptospira tipperaryensis]